MYVPEGALQGGGLHAGSAHTTSNATDRLSVGIRWDECLMYISMALLLVSTTQEIGPIGDAVKLVWLASFAWLTLLNAGAAFGVYVAALAVFAVVYFGGSGGLFARPDYYALLILVAGLLMRMVVARSSRLWDRSMLVIGGFLGYGLLHTALMGLLTRSVFAIYMSMLGLPMMMFLLLAQYGFSQREFRALVRSLLVLGTYMALVSIAERVGWYNLIVPAWIVDPSQASILAGLGPSGEVRSGGLLMQPAWNGLALSLIYCLAILSAHLFSRRSRWLGGVVSLLCLVGVFFSDTRAAWLGCAFASLILLWRPSTTQARTHLKRLGVVAATAACILALALLPETSARQRLDDAGTVLYRLNLWKVALSMAGDRPLLGSGFTTFQGNVADYRQEMTVGCRESGQIRCLGGRMNIGNDAAHNTLLSILVELGAIGLVLYLGALVVMFRRAKTAALQRWGREGALWVAIFFGVYFLQAQFAVAHEPTTNLIVFGTMGAIAGLLPRGPAGRSPEAPSLRQAQAPVAS